MRFFFIFFANFTRAEVWGIWTLGSLSFRMLCPPPFAAREPLSGVSGGVRWRFLNGWLRMVVFGMHMYSFWYERGRIVVVFGFLSLWGGVFTF